MQLSATRLSTLISLLFLLLPATHCNAEDREYQMLMNARGREISGMCIISQQGDDTITGTIVNDFGIKAFDFMQVKGKTKVMNVLGPLNKWYIRKVLKNDIAFILDNIDKHRDNTWKKRTIAFLPNGDVHVVNSRFRIEYTFTPMKQ